VRTRIGITVDLGIRNQECNLVAQLLRQQIGILHRVQLDHAAGGCNMIGMQLHHFVTKRIFGGDDWAGGRHNVTDSVTAFILPKYPA